MNKIVLFFSFLLLTSSIFAQKRGFVPVEVKINGTTTQMYKQSHALVIGNSAYTDNAWNVLPGVKSDVQKVKKALENNGFHVILKENLTKMQMITEIDNFLTQYAYDKDNRVLIYYAGHGHTLENNGSQMGYIVGIDAPDPRTNERGFISKSLPMSLFKTWSESSIYSKHSLFIFDACFAGTIFSSRGGGTGNYLIDYNTTNFVREFITSGSANETVPDKSSFCTQFVYALQSNDADMNHDGYLTGIELGEYLKNSVIKYSNGGQHPQYGKLNDPSFDKGDFVFVLKPKVETGKIQLFTEYSGQLFIDGTFYKNVSANNSYTFDNIEAGTKQIQIKGSENWNNVISITANQTTDVNAKKDVKGEKITIYSNPTNAEVVFNGQIIGKTPQTVFMNYGVNTIKFQGVELYDDMVQQINFDQNSNNVYSFNMRQNGIQANFTTNPAGAELKIDNKYIGTSPITVPLRFGTYNLDISKNGYSDFNKNITISKNTTNYNYNLTKIVDNSQNNTLVNSQYQVEYTKYKKQTNITMISMIGVAGIGLATWLRANSLYKNDYQNATTTTEATELHKKIRNHDVFAVGLFTVSATLIIPLNNFNEKKNYARRKMNNY